MFEEPAAKRIRREDLNSPVPLPRSSPDPAIEELLRSRVRNEFTFTITESTISAAGQGLESDEDETELRLFADAPNSLPRTYKIRLSSPGTENRDSGFKVKKPRNYYFAEEPTVEETAALQAAAIDGKTILELSKMPWPGCALPWKVNHISAAGAKKEVLAGHAGALVAGEEEAHKRTRKNKKTRIAIRKRTQTAKSKCEEMARLAREKDEAEREKRTRRNREKKVKRKAREKAKKELEDGGEDVAAEQS